MAMVLLSSCASYSVTEQEVQQYLDKKTGFERSVGVKGLAHAKVKFEDVKVGIGRISDDRVNLEAKSFAKVSIYGQAPQEIELNVNFSAIPFYDKSEGAIFLKDLEVEKLDIEPNTLNLPSKQLLSPIVEIVGQFFLSQPVYRLDEKDFKQSVLKTARPELLIKNHSLVIQI
ncbi:DUF1439 domain-containing protein [Photobacterium ganghwense]|uniref:Lipoprotein n=2 Tax=Vibrionaceae TaxID=641 RepID=A0A0J1HEP9_9GAMM|nr:hypothetical protein ABT57_05700 [Photobacterium ganghwense]MBV1841096.1 DUF1439 domain-containing protein [Photobacterium ganghwense]PSU05322.1 DUF1439 domain-containing protein [Photobacterium ganghwense]QSV17417.1 DUF1439 domain-containing protein [Photobacterium ganghwense]